MDHDQAHRHLSASHPRMAELIANSRRYNVAPAVSIRPFDALAESIAYQQLNGKAAAAIWNRVRGLYPKRKRLDPAKVLATPDETLRAAGLSLAKTPDAETAYEAWGEMATAPFGCGLVFLASAGPTRKVAKLKRLQELQGRIRLPFVTLVTI